MVLQPSVDAVRVEDVPAMGSHLHVLSLCHPLQTDTAFPSCFGHHRYLCWWWRWWPKQLGSVVSVWRGGRERGREDD